jgi:hypothetical protein
VNDSDSIGVLATATAFSLIGAAVLFLISAAAAQYFWRGAMTSAFMFKELSFSEACSLVGLCWCLFGGFRLK